MSNTSSTSETSQNRALIRKAFIMEILPGTAVEYERRHTPIWPELETAIREHGGHNYSIYLDPETNMLFGYVEIEDEKRWAAIGQTEIYGKWWAYMREIMRSNSDDTPYYFDLKEVFHLS